jgi:putative transposase
MPLPKPVFTPFPNPWEQAEGSYRRKLPHLRVPGATYFITFRQADSLPRKVILSWLTEHHAWLRDHGIEPELDKQRTTRFWIKWRTIPAEEREAHERRRAKIFLTELDHCHGSCVMHDANCRAVVADALRFFDTDRVWLGDFVVMPNHVHVIAQMIGDVELEDWVGSVKRHAARQIGKIVGTSPQRSGHFWMKESFDRVIRDREELRRTREYIRKNPASANLREDEATWRAAAWLDEFAPLVGDGGSGAAIARLRSTEP